MYLVKNISTIQPLCATTFRGLFYIIFILILSSTLQSQSITETRWLFGNSAENLVFDLNGRSVYLQTDQATPFGISGSATITDQFTGNLLIYTDGTNVYDASHTILPNGAGLSGVSSINVPVVTCPVTNNPDQYYFFTNSDSTGVNEIRYTIVDINLQGNGSVQFPSGDIVTGMRDVSTGLTDPSEGMIIVPSGDGELFWLITQNRTTFQIQVTQIDDSGKGKTTNYDFTSGVTPGFEASHFAFSADSSKLAMAPRTPNRNIWLMNFDLSRGVLTMDTTLLGTGFDDDQGESIYDIEWSSDGSKLYISRLGSSTTTGQLYQIDFNDSTKTVNPILPSPIFRSYGLKRSPDNRIYHLYQETNVSNFSLGRINNPDSLINVIDYEAPLFPNNFNATQFSEHVSGYNFDFDTLNFYWIDSCATNVTKFFPIVEPIPNKLTWDFGDGQNFNGWIPNHTYETQGGYMVRLTAEVNGITHTIAQPVEILTNDLMIDLGRDTTICVDEILKLDAGSGISYVWSTGETTQTIEIDTAGTYWVEVMNATGCTDFDDIEVIEYGVSNQTSNQWYFGEQAGIEFTNGPIPILDGNKQDAPEGCATISDVNGSLLFYTNGVTVWNRTHKIMLNGDNIGGDLASAQNTLIMPFGNDLTMFYIFTTEQVYGDNEYALRYSIVDMKEDSTRGKIVIKNIKLMDNSTERITGSSFTGNDIILVHEFGNNTFRSYQTSPSGLSQAIYSPVGIIHDFMQESSATGYMKISPTSNQIAINIPSTNQVEILDFDQGEVSNPRLIDIGEHNLYGMEFSSSGSRLYLSTSSDTSKLIQYDLDSLNSEDPVADITDTKFDGYPQGINYGALQVGPNDIIYMAIDNSGTIGTINSPNKDDTEAGFNAKGFDLSGRTSRLGLPNFVQNQSPPLQVPTMTVMDGCLGQQSVFSSVGRDPNNLIENYLWIFGDGTSASVQDTTHMYNSTGLYTVQLILSNKCDNDTTLTQIITIHPIPENPTVPTDTLICIEPVVLTAWPVDNPDFTYYWNTGESTREIIVSEPAAIKVAIINSLTGCSSDTLQVFIADARPDVTLGKDRIVCQNDPMITLDAGVTRASYSWAINGVVSGSNRTFNINTATNGTFKYTVKVTNSFGCIRQDTIQVTVQERPDVTVVPTATTGCGNDDGYMTMDFNTTGNFSYQLSGATTIGPFNVDGPATVTIPTGVPPVLGNLPPDNYNLLVTNLVSGCTYTEIVQIEDPGTFMLSGNTSNACPGDGFIGIDFGGTIPTNFNLSIEDKVGKNIIDVSLTSTYANPVVQNLDTGTYLITVREIGGLGCVETDEIVIQSANPQPTFTFDAIQNICGSQGNVSIVNTSGESITYNWTGVRIIGTNIGNTIIVDQSGVYTVTGSGTGFCPRSENIKVNFNADPVVNVNLEGDPCKGQVTLIANVTGGSGRYLYNWNNGSGTMQNIISNSGTYRVKITDQLTGCEVTSQDMNLEIQNDLQVSLSLQPDCSNNKNVFLTASTNYFNPSITYEWKDERGTTLTDTDSILKVTQAGKYTVVVTNESGTCTSSNALEVVIVPINPEDITLPKRSSYCLANPETPSVNLNPGIFNTYKWRLLPNDLIISTNQVLNVSTAGTYEVTLYNGFTCIKSKVEVTENCRPIIFTPNAFSPNEDKVNNEFFVFPDDYVDKFEILIYTRWGELVYTSKNINFRWNGTYKGILLPVGTYTFILKFSSSLARELGTIEQYGSVILIR